MFFAPLVPAVLSIVLSFLSATAAPVSPCLGISGLNITAQFNDETGALNVTPSNYQFRVYWGQGPSSSPIPGGEGRDFGIDPLAVLAYGLPNITEEVDSSLSTDRKSTSGETVRYNTRDTRISLTVYLEETIPTKQLEGAFYEGLAVFKKLTNMDRTRWAPTAFNSQSGSAQKQWPKFGARYHITYADLNAIWPAITKWASPTPHNFARFWTFHVTCTEDLAAHVSTGRGNITLQTSPVSARRLSIVAERANSAAMLNITQSANAEINYPIPHTGYTLRATEFGDMIPTNELTAAFDDAMTGLQVFVDYGAGDRVPEAFEGLSPGARVRWKNRYWHHVTYSDLVLVYRALKMKIAEQATAETFAYSRSCRWWVERYAGVEQHIVGVGSVTRVQVSDAAQLSLSGGNASSTNSISDA